MRAQWKMKRNLQNVGMITADKCYLNKTIVIILLGRLYIYTILYVVSMFV